MRRVWILAAAAAAGAALLGAGPASGAGGANESRAGAVSAPETDPLYWHSIYRPARPHRIRVLVPTDRDFSAILVWIRSRHPAVGIRAYPDGTVDFETGGGDYGAVAAYLTSRLKLSSDHWVEVQAAEMFGPLPGESCLRRVAVTGGRYVRSDTICRLNEAALRASGVRLGHPKEIVKKRRALARDAAVLGDQLRRLPAVASLLESQRDTLDWSESLRRFFTDTVTIRLALPSPRMAYAADGVYMRSPPGRGEVDAAAFAERWNLLPKSRGRAAVDPCLLTGGLYAEGFTPRSSGFAARLRGMIEGLGGKADPLPACGNATVPAFLIPRDAAKRLMRDLPGAASGLSWRTIPPGEAEQTSLALRDALVDEAKRLDASRTPAIAGLVAAELERLAPLDARRRQVGDMVSFQFRSLPGEGPPPQ